MLNKKLTNPAVEPQEARNYMMFARVAMGESIRDVAMRYNVSAPRTHQIIGRTMDKIVSDNVGAPEMRFGSKGVMAVRLDVDGWLAAAKASYNKRTGDTIEF